jgi:hypothetical protein
VFPHDFLKVNTIFEVIHRAGGRTAWSDKHPAYDIVNGPSGAGVDDLYTPEINSLIANGGTVNGVDLAGSMARCDGTTNSLPLAKVDDFTTCEPAMMAYDDTKVQAVINELNGKTSDGSRRARVPTILGMNFQGVSVGEKLPVGGYADGAGTPSPLLDASIAHVDASLGRMVDALEANHLSDSTLFIVSAKHGQSPMDASKLAMEPGGSGNATVTDPIGFINAADPNVDAVFGSYVNPNNASPYAISGHLKTDDVGIVWLQDQSPANVAAVVAQLTNAGNRTSMHADALPAGTIFESSIVSGMDLAAIYGNPTSSDPVAAARAPNVFIQPNWGVIYSGSKKKIAEHGGGTIDDTHVALSVSGPGLRPGRVSDRVSTTAVAPTILSALDLDPAALAAVRKEGTRVLPGLGLEEEHGSRFTHSGLGDTLVLSRVQYDGNTFGNPGTYPTIFADPTVSGVQGSIHIDRYRVVPGMPRIDSIALDGITTSFSSKSEGALMRSVDGSHLTYMGYAGPVGAQGVSNSYTTGANLAGNTAPLFDRAVAVIDADGSFKVQPEVNAYSGDNPRAAISVDGTQFYMAGNADSTIAGGVGPGTTIGARYGTLGSDNSLELGAYVAADRTDESAKKHVKDSNFRGVNIFDGNLYVSKGSGGNGDNGIFQVGSGLPTTAGNTVTLLLGGPATDPVSGEASPFTPFGFWFANPTTLYIADEGIPNTDEAGNLVVDPMAGLQKWTLVGGVWTLDYVLQAGLDLGVAKAVDGYPVPTMTYGLRNMTGKVNQDGSATIYAITAQWSSISGGEPDPTSLVVVTDAVDATTLPPAGPAGGDETFLTLANSGTGGVFRGVAFAPCAGRGPRCSR